MTVLRGRRVMLRPWRDADFAPFAAMNDDPEVMRHLSGRLSPEDSDALARRLADRVARDGFGLWAVELPDRAFAGFVGLSAPPFEISLPGLLAQPHEIGWRLARAAWGQGYATEAARLVLRHGFDVLALRQIVSFTVPANTRSEAVMRRIGLTRRGEFAHPRFADGHPLHRQVLYAAERPPAP